MRSFLIFLFTLNCAFVNAQFIYFNQIYGEQNDLLSEGCSNVEVVDDGYVIWGGGIDDNTLLSFVQKYSLSGVLIDENILFDDSAEYVYAGITKSFQWNPYTEIFVFIQGVNLLGQGNLEGYLIEFDTNLDTTFTRRYNQYAPYTYPFVFQIEEDGYVVVGETGNSTSAGTFIMKLDFEGNVLWSEIMQPVVSGDIYRNNSILKLEDQYMISGYGQVDNELFGLISFVDHDGTNLETIISVDPEMERSGGFISARLLNWDIAVSQSFSFEQYTGSGNPNMFWRLTRFGKYNEETGEIEDQIDYFNNYDNFQKGGLKLIPTSDGGVLMLGSQPGLYFDREAWVLKLDSNLNQDWYHEYTYETCNDCENILYDIELAPDGGYVAAGSFVNYDVDPRQSTWLLKVDACGDVEWQDCTPFGLEEKEPKIFSVYPNPSAGRFVIESDFNHSIASWAVYSLSGKKVAEGISQHTLNLEISLELPSGLYALELVQKDGKRENHKIQILK